MFGICGTQVGVFQHAIQVSFRGFMDGQDGIGLNHDAQAAETAPWSLAGL